jgi:hypothetical protein
MLRFTIRDLLWLMAVVGLAVGWWMNSVIWKQERTALQESLTVELRRNQEMVDDAKSAVEQLRERITKARRDGIPLPVMPAELERP